MIHTLTLYPAKIMAGILAGFLSLFVQNLLQLTNIDNAVNK